MNATAAAATADVTEDWQMQVGALAVRNGWRWCCTLDTSATGFPNMVLVRPPRFLVVRAVSAGRRISPAQQAWLDHLASCGIETYLWRPEHLDQVRAVLSQRHPVTAEPSNVIPLDGCRGFVPKPGFGSARICKTCGSPWSAHEVRAQ